MTELLIRENDISEMTSLSGNIDVDKLIPYIALTQKTDLKRILTKTLFDKIYADFIADTLAGLYLEIYNDYVLDMLVHFSCAKYMAFGGYKTTNNGIHKMSFDGGQIVDYKEVAILISRYEQLASNTELAFYGFMADNPVPEYDISETTETTTNIFNLY
jgi:hypothetical protein